MAVNIPIPQLIDAPPVPPRPYGLFDVATGPMPLPTPMAGMFGLIYVPDTCVSDVFLYQITNNPSVSGSKTFSGIDTAVSGAPFGVIVSYTCASVGWTQAEIEQRLATRMMLREQRAVERRLWQGQLGGSQTLGPILGQFRGATALAAASCITEATEMLEQALADNGVVGGMIHARPGMNPHFANGHILEKSGRQFTTPLGTPIVFGQGYDGSGPNGEVPDTDNEYMYASGRVLVWQETEPFTAPISQIFNTSTNTISNFSERKYLTTVECGVWSIKVTRNCTTAP